VLLKKEGDRTIAHEFTIEMHVAIQINVNEVKCTKVYNVSRSYVLHSKCHFSDGICLHLKGKLEMCP